MLLQTSLLQLVVEVLSLVCGLSRAVQEGEQRQSLAANLVSCQAIRLECGREQELG